MVSFTPSDVNVDQHPAVIAWSPLLDFGECSDLDVIRQAAGREHEVQLTTRGQRRLLAVVKRGHAQAGSGNLCRPRVGLATVGGLRADEEQAECLRLVHQHRTKPMRAGC